MAGSASPSRRGNRTEPPYYEVTTERLAIPKGTVAQIVGESTGDHVVVAYEAVGPAVTDEGVVAEVPLQRMIGVSKKTFLNNAKKTTKKTEDSE